MQDEIIQSISSFALYGFPESHAASFALIAYASAYLKCNYLAAFTAALLNNQPMGFYSPATIVKDAQRHGLRVKPVDVRHSALALHAWRLSPDNPHRFALRLGLCYARGLRRETAIRIDRRKRAASRFNRSKILRCGCPSCARANWRCWRRSARSTRWARWHIAAMRSGRWSMQGVLAGPLLDELAEPRTEQHLLPRTRRALRAVQQMTIEERLVADFSGTGVTVGRHPMAFHRARAAADGNTCRCELVRMAHGRTTRIAGCVIARQRPGTAKGFVFLSIEDETGIANAIITPTVYEQFKQVVIYEKFLLIEGELQNQENVISVKAHEIRPLQISEAEVRSHDFH